MTRVVMGLTSASACARPTCIPRSRPRGTKGLGLSYERTVASAVRRAFPTALHGQWFQYEDSHGRGYCQPDILLISTSVVWVLECKLSNVDEARAQIALLYAPILRYVYKRDVRGIVVARHLTRIGVQTDVFSGLRDAMKVNDFATFPVLHYLGKGSIA